MAPIKREMTDDEAEAVPKRVTRSQQRAARDNKEPSSNSKRPRRMDTKNGSTPDESENETKPVLHPSDALALCAVSPHRPRRALVARRVITEETVVQKLPVIPAAPVAATPTFVFDYDALVAAMFRHLDKNPQDRQLLGQATAAGAGMMGRVQQAAIAQPAADSPAALAGESQQLQLTMGPDDAEEDEFAERTPEERTHIKFWRGKSKRKTCPACTRDVGISKKARQDHYLQHHYNVYYPLVGQKSVVERWVGERLGKGPINNKNRVCLHCTLDVGYKGRIELIRHFRKAHPEKWAEMKEEYKVVARKQQVKDEEVHRRLIHVSTRSHE